MRRGLLVTTLLAAAPAPPAAARQGPDPLQQGRALESANPGAALRLFEQALAADSLQREANWRAAVAAVEWGQEAPDSSRATRDSLYLLAERYARRAVALDSTEPNGLFALAMALGRIALTKGRRERLRLGAEVYAAATRGLAATADHDGLHHVLGLWHAEVMRLSGLSRFVARNILGARVLGQASWTGAIEHLERAVALDSTRIYHRLDLAKVYADRKRYQDARGQLAAIRSLPDRVPLDARYRAEAEALLARLAGR